MRKYWFIFSLYLQDGLQKRSSFFMERFRSLVVLLSFYYLWSALLSQRPSFAGYDRSEMLTYVLGMNILRSWVFAGKSDEIAYEINRGDLSGFLLKPVSFMAYAFFRDLSEKSINLVSAIIEVWILCKVFDVPIAWPQHGSTWMFFLVALTGALFMNFLLNFMAGCWGFWTAESGGPRFFLELVLEFSAGAFFPLSILPESVQSVLKMLPSPYLIFFPLNLFLEKVNPADLISGLAIQFTWLFILAACARLVWMRGLRVYAAQGG